MKYKQSLLTIPPLLLFIMIFMGQNCAKYKPITEAGDNQGSSTSPAPVPLQKGPIELWYWHHSYLSPTNTSEPAKSKALIDRAVAAGYTGLAFWDASVAFLDRPTWDRAKMREVVQYAKSKGLKVLPGSAHFGYSNDTLMNDPNMAEGQRVTGTQFRVVDAGGGAKKLEIVNSLPPVKNPGMENGKTDWFGTGDSRVDVDTSQRHTGTKSAIIRAGTGTNARLVQKLTVIPWRIYHVQFWAKTVGFSGGLNLRMLDFRPNNLMLNRLEGEVKTQPDQDWKVYDYTFNSRDSQEINIYLGNWGGSQGSIWIDDVTVVETALINVLRREGTPIRIYDPASPSTVFVENQHVGKVEDPIMLQYPGTYHDYHNPPTISVPAGSPLALGQTLAMDYYTAYPIYGFQMGACLTDVGYKNLTIRNVRAIAEVFGAENPLMLSYDEMRHGNSCDACRKKNLSAGELLAWQLQDLTAAIKREMPNSQLYTWSDMFSPFHNAKGNFYNVEGDWSGSWNGLSPDIIIMNWNLGKLIEDLKWFAGMDPRRQIVHRQIIAGYYDSGDGAKSASDELKNAQGIPGVLGLMYTSWVDGYDQLEEYASSARAGWKAYQDSY